MARSPRTQLSDPGGLYDGGPSAYVVVKDPERMVPIIRGTLARIIAADARPVPEPSTPAAVNYHVATTPTVRTTGQKADQP